MLIVLSGKTSSDGEHAALVTNSFFNEQQVKIDAIMQRLVFGCWVVMGDRLVDGWL